MWARRKTGVAGMAAADLIHRLKSKLEARGTKLDVRAEALIRKLCFIQWTIGLGLIAAAGAVIALIQALP